MLGTSGRRDIIRRTLASNIHHPAATSGTTRCHISAESVTVALREENAKVRPEYAEPVKRYINAHKTVAVQAAILMSPRTAREIAVAGMISYRRCVNVSVSAHGGLRFFKTNADTTSPALQKVEEEAKRFALLLGADAEDTATANDAVDFLLQSHRSDAQAYRLCKTLSNADLEALHLFLTTISFGFADLHVLDGNPSTLVNTVAADLAVNMVDNWRPDEHFLSKRNRQQLEAIIKEADTGGFMPKAKKGEMVAITAARFAAGEKEATRNWLPGAMQFPATGPDISVHHANDDDEHDAGIEDEDPETGIDEDHGEDDGEHYAEAAE